MQGGAGIQRRIRPKVVVEAFGVRTEGGTSSIGQIHVGIAAAAVLLQAVLEGAVELADLIVAALTVQDLLEPGYGVDGEIVVDLESSCDPR